MASVKEYIINLLKKNEIAVAHNYFENPSPEKIAGSTYYPMIEEVYKDLGGLNSSLPLVVPEYDIQVEKAIILIDNESMYNRYRANTFRSDVYKELKSINIENQKRFCRQFESDCLKSAGNFKMWSNQESTLHFGKSQDIGDLSAPGASLWKLNAFINFLVDVSSILSKATIFRISPYDNLVINGKMIKVKDLLMSRNTVNESYLLRYILRGIGMESKSNTQTEEPENLN